MMPKDKIADTGPARDDTAESAQEELKRLRGERKQKRLTNAQKEMQLAFMNKHHAFIANYGGKAMVTDFQPVPDDPTRQRRTFVELSAIRARYANQFVSGSEDTDKPKAVGAWWLQRPKRLEYAGVWFDPGGPEVLVF